MNKVEKHTPGPWVWERGTDTETDYETDCGTACGSLYGLGGVKVLADWGPEGYSFGTFYDDIDTANARLIAAAPELYGALIDCAFLIKLMADELENMGLPNMAIREPVLENARQVLSKVTGIDAETPAAET